MILLHLLSGRQAGQDVNVRRFPFSVGRGRSDLVLDEAGVWDRHLEIDFDPSAGICFLAHPEASVLVNGEAAGDGVLRNGDLVTVGSVRFRIWLTPTEQRRQAWREGLTWAALALLFLGQAALVVFLLS